MTVREARTGVLLSLLFGAMAGLLLFAFGCTVPPAPVVTPQPQLTSVRVAVTVLDASRQAIPGLACVLVPDDWPPIPCVYNGLQAVAQVPYGRYGWGGELRLGAEGFQPYVARVTIAADLPEVTLQAIAKLAKLRYVGRHGFVDADTGAKVPWTSRSGFQFVELVAHGRQAEAAAFLKSLPSRGARVFLMAAYLFQLSPDEGLAALPPALTVAEQAGKYVSLTVFADTKSYPSIDYRAIADRVGSIACQSPAVAFVEIGNELYPLHSTQAAPLGDPAFREELRAIIRSHCDIPVSLGSTHGPDDESDAMKGGDLLTIHGDRSEGGEGKWRPLRHTNEQRALSDRLGLYDVNDEPSRSYMDCDWQIGMGVLTRMFDLGDTAHDQAGLFALPATGLEAQGLACRARGWAAIPDDWQGSYMNAGFAGSPVKSFDGAVRVYSSVNGGRGYSLVLGATGGLRIDWNDGWRNELVLSEGGAALFRVTR